MFKQWRFWLGLLTSLVFLSLALRNQDLNQLTHSLASADYRYLVPAVAVYFAGVYLRAMRWHVLLRSIKPLRASTLFPFVVIGFMANNLLPARTGEFVRAYTLSWRTGIRKSASLATIAIERVFDGLTMILFILVASLLIRLNQQVQGLTIIAAVIFLSLLAGLLGYSLFPPVQQLVLAILHRLLPDRLADRLEAIATAFVQGLGSLRSRADLLYVVLTSIAAWLCEAGMYLVIAAAFGLDLGWPAALLATAVANLATLLPSSPGYVGIFEWGILIVLVGLLGLPEATALSYAIVLHAALWLPVTTLGLIFWSRESLSWSTLNQLKAERADADLVEPRLPTSSRG